MLFSFCYSPPYPPTGRAAPSPEGGDNHIFNMRMPSGPNEQGQATEGVTMYEVEVKVVLKKGVADPEGANTAKTLKLLGFEGIKEVRSAKVFRIFLDADDEAKAEEMAKDMCDKLLANPVVNDFSIQVKEG